MKLLRGTLIALAVALCLAPLGAGRVSAGGWAVVTLDAIPEPVAGEPVEVGFTILQHGVTPVNPEGEIALDIVGPKGSFSVGATAQGAVGHYVAEVTFPAQGSYTWTVRPGWFPPQPLGSVGVAAAATQTATETDTESAALAEPVPTPASVAKSATVTEAASVAEASGANDWPLWRTGALAAGALCLALAVGSAVHGRRRDSDGTPTEQGLSVG